MANTATIGGRARPKHLLELVSINTKRDGHPSWYLSQPSCERLPGGRLGDFFLSPDRLECCHGSSHIEKLVETRLVLEKKEFNWLHTKFSSLKTSRIFVT